MPVRSYGPRIVKKSRPGKHPRWKKSDLRVELERVARAAKQPLPEIITFDDP